MISPSSEVELSELLLDSSEPIRIIGGGTRQNLGNNVQSKKNISTSKLTGITLLEPAALTLVAVSYTHLTLPTTPYV